MREARAAAGGGAGARCGNRNDAMARTHDVVIIGAGPAGTATAACLWRHGVRDLLALAAARPVAGDQRLLQQALVVGRRTAYGAVQ